jgi:hypothetical protein
MFVWRSVLRGKIDRWRIIRRCVLDWRTVLGWINRWCVVDWRRLTDVSRVIADRIEPVNDEQNVERSYGIVARNILECDTWHQTLRGPMSI